MKSIMIYWRSVNIFWFYNMSLLESLISVLGAKHGLISGAAFCEISGALNSKIH